MTLITFEVKFLGRRILYPREIPEHLRDLTGKQYLALIRFLFAEISETKFIRTMVNPPLLALSWRNRSFWKYRLIDAMIPLFDLRQPCNRFLIPNLKELEAPLDNLKGVSLMRFMYIDSMYTSYLNHKENAEFLLNMISAIYLRSEVEFETMNFKSHLEKVRKMKLPRTTQMAILYNYMMVKTWLGTRFPFLFVSDQDDEKKTSHRGKRSNWLDIFDSFVGDDIPATEYYKKMPCMDAFRLMNNRINNYQHGK